MTSVYEPWEAARGAEIISEHSKVEGATLVILHALQEAFGYVPEEALPMIASELNLSRAEVYGVAAALSVGADEFARALQAAAAKRNLPIELVRTGSRGLYWLEPMLEVATAKGRVAFGPVTVADVPSLLDAI